jgi:hypothetical protein
MRNKTIRRKIKVRQKHKTRKVGSGFFNFFKSAPSAVEPQIGIIQVATSSNNFASSYPNIQMNDLNNVRIEIQQRLNIAKRLYNTCKSMCKEQVCKINEDVCNQAERMSVIRPATEFISFCRTSGGITDKSCKEIQYILNSLSKIKYKLESTLKSMGNGGNNSLKSQYKNLIDFIKNEIEKFEKKEYNISLSQRNLLKNTA